MPSNSTQPDDSPESHAPIYFFGCDMGGWHTRGKDALATCSWNGTAFDNHQVEHGRLFFPLANDGTLLSVARRAIADGYQCVFAIDAALAWPRDFLCLAVSCPKASHLPDFDPAAGQMQNRYLFRETERFIRQHVRTNKDPFTAPGDAFGNPSSKAQALVAFLKSAFPNAYRPPFDEWDVKTARITQVTIIEVYPAASSASDQFRQLRWHSDEESYGELSVTDENDAKRCATTAICYAMSVGMMKQKDAFPTIWFPDEVDAEFDSKRITKEGWIFAPKLSSLQEADE